MADAEEGMRTRGHAARTRHVEVSQGGGDAGAAAGGPVGPPACAPAAGATNHATNPEVTRAMFQDPS